MHRHKQTTLRNHIVWEICRVFPDFVQRERTQVGRQRTDVLVVGYTHCTMELNLQALVTILTLYENAVALKGAVVEILNHADLRLSDD